MKLSDDANKTFHYAMPVEQTERLIILDSLRGIANQKNI